MGIGGGSARWWRGVRARLRGVKFSFACQKRTRKAPATFEAREARIKGYSPLIIPRELSKRKKASRCAKRFFLVSPTCCFAAGVTFLQDVKFSDDVKSSAEPYMGEAQKNAFSEAASIFGLRLLLWNC